MPMNVTMIRRTSLAVVACAAALIAPSAAGAKTVFTLNGHGWGHGIGMSQYGALGYAQHGWAYDRILGHYFKDTTLGSLPRGTRERVLLVSGKGSIHFSTGDTVNATDGSSDTKSLPAGSYRVDTGPVAGNLRLWSSADHDYIWKRIQAPLAITAGSSPLELDDAALNGYDNDHWWGDFRIDRTGGGPLSLVNVVPMEKYVRGVVPCEVPASWLAAAVRAQAVAARSYAAATAGGADFDAYPDTRSQMYCPIEKQAAASDAAVKATARQVVMYNGSVATAFFSSSSGGRTSSISASWGGTDLPYLAPVKDRYDGANGDNPNHTWSPVKYSRSGLASALGFGGKVGSLDMSIDHPSQRVLSAVFHTSKGDRTLTASDVFSRLRLRSTYFRIVQATLSGPSRIKKGDSFMLTGRLWPRSGSTVKLEVRTSSSGTWKTIDRKVKLGSDGRFSLRRRPSGDVSYRISRKRVFSPVVRVDVRATLTAHSMHPLVTPGALS
jgi:stage II sporulation protein D